MTIISLPAEKWEEYAQACSAQILIETKKGTPAPVRAVQHGGHLYTVLSVRYGPYGDARCGIVHAWKLLPVEIYQGETTWVYHDEAAIRAGLRKRGDHAGLIVSVNGKLMVCAEKAVFHRDLPTTKPLSLAEAMNYDERQRRSGWRALWFRRKEPEWFSLRGHPVAVYRGHKSLGDDFAVLLWNGSGQIHDLPIAVGVKLSPAESAAAISQAVQMVLF